MHLFELQLQSGDGAQAQTDSLPASHFPALQFEGSASAKSEQFALERDQSRIQKSFHDRIHGGEKRIVTFCSHGCLCTPKEPERTISAPWNALKHLMLLDTGAKDERDRTPWDIVKRVVDLAGT